MVAPTSLPSDLWIRTETMYRYYLVLGLSCNSVCVSKVIKEEDSCGLKTFKLLIYVLFSISNKYLLEKEQNNNDVLQFNVKMQVSKLYMQVNSL